MPPDSAKSVVHQWKQIPPWVRKCCMVWFGFWALTGFILIYPVIFVTMLRPAWYAYSFPFRKFWMKWMLFWGFVKIKVSKSEHPSPDGGCIYVSNHTSQIDIPVMIASVDDQMKFMARSDLGKVPLFGVFARTTDISVDPNDPARSALSFRKAVRMIQDGHHLTIYPEANISRTVPQMDRFHDGAFRLAILTQCPIVPVTLMNSWNILPDTGRFDFFPGTALVYVHEPFPTLGMTVDQTDELKKRIFTIIENKLKEHGYLG